MFDKSKMPPGLLKEIPGKANDTARAAKSKALQRRLEKTKTDDSRTITTKAMDDIKQTDKMKNARIR